MATTQGDLGNVYFTTANGQVQFFDNTSTGTPFKNINDIKVVNENALKYYKDNSTLQFKYGLDFTTNYGYDEDPVIFGFDLKINTISSPLFNDINDFFNYYSTGNNTINEIVSAQKIYSEFINRLCLFFDAHSAKYIGNFKAHYLKKISGLENLVETFEKRFIDYEKDIIKLEIQEDVKLNGGILGFLYKTMTWSKVNGKELIPDNMLRFDIDIVVSEIRNFQKMIKNNQSTDVFNDNVSRYVYSLYDCQFVFDNMSHKGEVSNESIDPADSFEIGINYKFATLKFEKWDFRNQTANVPLFVDNYYDNTLKSADSQLNVLNLQTQNPNGIATKPDGSQNPLRRYGTNEDQQSATDAKSASAIDLLKAAQKKADTQSYLQAAATNFVKQETGAIAQLKKSAIAYANTKAQALRSQALAALTAKVRGTLGLPGAGISPPYNVYEDSSLSTFAADQFKQFTNLTLNSATNAFVNMPSQGNNFNLNI